MSTHATPCLCHSCALGRLKTWPGAQRHMRAVLAVQWEGLIMLLAQREHTAGQLRARGIDVEVDAVPAVMPPPGMFPSAEDVVIGCRL